MTRSRVRCGFDRVPGFFLLTAPRPVRLLGTRGPFRPRHDPGVPAMPVQRITPCLWFDSQAEDAARLYCGVFPNSRVVAVTRYGSEGHEIHRRPAGSVMTVEFVLDGVPFTALNGGPVFKFNEAV